MNKLPLYKVVLGEGEGSGMFRISLVNRPAIEEGFITLSEEEKPAFKFANEEKKQVVGPIMIPDMPIYRSSPTLGEYNIVFPKDTIEKIMYKYSKDGLFNSFNIEHALDTQDVTMLEVWMKETDQDKSNSYGFNLPVGTVFVKAQIESDALWTDIKSNELNGFSIEIKSDIVEQKMNSEMDFKFAVELGERIAKLEAAISEIAEKMSVVEEVEVVQEVAEEMSAEEPAVEAAPITEEVSVEEPVAEQEVFSAQEAPEVVENQEVELSTENKELEENSVQEAELALSAEQEGVDASNQEAAEDKTRNFERITSDKVKMIDKFLGKRFY
tara:strand:+ start:2401 stop:3381 length:981 start_codon:yes stop_codon:yes gene_type:complete